MLEHTDTQRRCLTYIAAKAEAEGLEYDLEPTSLNSVALEKLWDACLEYDANDPNYTKELLQALCDNLLDASLVSTLQGIRHKEPESMEVYQRMFNHNHAVLNLRDTPYTPVKGETLELRWSVESDNPEVLRLQPGYQFTLDFDGASSESLKGT